MRQHVLAIVFAAVASVASAQTPPAETAPPATPAAPETAAASVSTPEGMVRIPAGTVVRVAVTDALNSRTSRQGETFALQLVQPIIIGDREVVPAGAVGGGEVIDAVPSGFGGRQGRLIVSARFLDLNGERVRIRGMQLTAVGENRANTALGVSMIPYVGLASIFIEGGEIDIPVGASGTARIAADVDIPATPPPAEQLADTTTAAAREPAAEPPPTTGENEE